MCTVKIKTYILDTFILIAGTSILRNSLEDHKDDDHCNYQMNLYTMITFALHTTNEIYVDEFNCIDKEMQGNASYIVVGLPVHCFEAVEIDRG